MLNLETNITHTPQEIWQNHILPLSGVLARRSLSQVNKQMHTMVTQYVMSLIENNKQLTYWDIEEPYPLFEDTILKLIEDKNLDINIKLSSILENLNKRNALRSGPFSKKPLLHYFATSLDSNGQFILKFLLDISLYPNKIIDDKLPTPLFSACLMGFFRQGIQNAMWLLEAGADSRILNAQNETSFTLQTDVPASSDDLEKLKTFAEEQMKQNGLAAKQAAVGNYTYISFQDFFNVNFT